MAWRNPWYDDSEPEVNPFIEKLIGKGFHYNDEEDLWERTWMVATQSSGAETSKEVYKQRDDEWSVVMYGNEGDVFFEHKIDGTK